MELDELRERISALAGSSIVRVEPIASGGNSDAYCAIAGDGGRFFCKRYSTALPEGGDRLAKEFSALSLLAAHDIRQVPRPIACDGAAGLAVYEYIDGVPVRAEGISDADVEAAAGFLRTLLRIPRDVLEPAAEAFFSFEEVAENIRWRVARFEDSAVEGNRAAAARRFLHEALAPALDAVLAWGEVYLRETELSLSRPIPEAARVPSPSDFGFHNAIRTPDDGLVFVDFEYFGVDDPAKTISDFLWHPAMTLWEDQKRLFVARVLEGMPEPELLAKRLPVAYPLFGLKWCLIVLNAFLPGARVRRTVPAAALEAVEDERLEKARAFLRRVLEEYKEFPYSVA